MLVGKTRSWEEQDITKESSNYRREDSKVIDHQDIFKDLSESREMRGGRGRNPNTDNKMH